MNTLLKYGAKRRYSCKITAGLDVDVECCWHVGMVNDQRHWNIGVNVIHNLVIQN